MFCPGCGLEEIQSNQFCRACGTDLRPVRNVMAAPDNITASAVSAREEIGRAVAAKIRETPLAQLSEVAEDVLPEIEKFLESPEEKRLRRIRTGTIVSSIGAGVAIAFTLVALAKANPEIMVVSGMGLIAFFIGLGLLINGMYLTVPRNSLSDRSPEGASQRELDGNNPVSLSATTNDLQLPGATSLFSSVTENTTRHLEEKQPVKR